MHYPKCWPKHWQNIGHELCDSGFGIRVFFFDRSKIRLTTRENPRSSGGSSMGDDPTSGPIPKFVSYRGTLVYELRNLRTTSNSMILVPLLNPKFADRICRTMCANFGFGARVGQVLRK